MWPKKKLGDDSIELIKNKINEDVSITLGELKNVLQNNLNITTSVSSVYRAINSFNYTFKKTVLIPEARNSNINVEKRKEYASQFMLMSTDSLVFLDEMGVNCSMRRSYGRSLAGTSPRKTVRSIRSKNYSVSAAITRRGVFYFQVLSHAYNGIHYQAFIQRIIDKFAQEGLENRILIMDNCSMHKVAPVRELIENAGHRLVFLPPYTPQLNPIEELF